MSEEVRREADRRFEEALAGSGSRDPRDFYRTALRELRGENPAGYEKAVSHFTDRLLPSIASGKREPLPAWRDYGCLIAELRAPGRAVVIDETGRSLPFDPDEPMDRLVLHLPEEKGKRALVVSLPTELSRAQRATYDLLVAGKHRLADSS